MQPDAAEVGSKSVARFNGPGRRQPKMGAGGRGDTTGAIKPRIARQGYGRFLTLKDFDGRCRAAARVKEIMGALEADLGGRDRLSEAQRQLVTRAAMLSVQAEDYEARFMLGEPHEVDVYLTTTNNLRRVLVTLGLERRARDVTPSLHEYIAQKAEAAS